MTKEVSAKSGYSIVIPCYNEQKRISKLMEGLQKFAREWDTPYELIFVDDGSTDGTGNIIETHPLFTQLHADGKAFLIKYDKNKGKGYALKQGVLSSRYEFILTLDADLACHPLELKKWIGPKKKKFDNNTIYIGSRVLKESVISDRNERKIVGHVFNFLVQMLSPLSARDSQCGFKLYPAGVAKELFSELKVNGWAHDVELLYRANLKGVEVKEMPITWKAVEGSKLSIAKDSLKMFLQLILINFIVFFDYFIKEPIAAIRGKFNDGDAIFRLPFIIISFVVLVGMPILSFQYGISGDEKTQDDYGHQVYNYVFKHDPSAITYNKPDGMHFYGGLFDFLAVCFSKLFPHIGSFEARHLFNSLFGALAIIFTGLLATKMLNWRAGLIALAMAILSPRIFGESMNNPKDIPYAMANIVSLYFIFAFITQLPKPSYRTILLLALSIGMAIGIRVGGILLIAYLGLFTIVQILANKDLKTLYFGASKKQLSNLFKYGILITVVAYILGLLTWPYGLANPLSNPLHALAVMSNYNVVNIRVLFKGVAIMNNEIPPIYVPTWISITTPLVVLSGLLLFTASFFVFKKRPSFLSYFMLLFTIIFPVAYVIYKKSDLHDGMRHFYFVALSIVVCGSLGWSYLMETLPKKAYRWVVAVVILLGLLLPARFMYANHPNEYVYFNELEGGIKNAFGNYETDYYMNSIKQSSDWFHKNVLPNVHGKKIIIGSNCIQPLVYYFRNDTAKVQLLYLRYRERAQKNWDYAINYSRFMDPEYLRMNYWPDVHSIHVVSVDGVPISNVVERTDKSDYYGFQALNKGDLISAEADFKKALQYDPNNEDVYDGLARAYQNQNKMAQTDSILKVGLQKFPYSTSLLSAMANLKLSAGNANEGLQYLQAILQHDPENLQVYESIIKIYQSIGDNASAGYYMDKATKIQEKLQAAEDAKKTNEK